MKHFTIILALLMTLSSPVMAQNLANNFRTDVVLKGYKAGDMETSISFVVHILTVNQSLSIANELAEVKGVKLYCPASNVPITTDVLHEVVSVEMMNARTRGDYDFFASKPFAFTALMTLVKFFPC